jgi:hypothetical protein
MHARKAHSQSTYHQQRGHLLLLRIQHQVAQHLACSCSHTRLLYHGCTAGVPLRHESYSPAEERLHVQLLLCCMPGLLLLHGGGCTAAAAAVAGDCKGSLHYARSALPHIDVLHAGN